jgi:hypothetical protein
MLSKSSWYTSALTCSPAKTGPWWPKSYSILNVYSDFSVCAYIYIYKIYKINDSPEKIFCWKNSWWLDFKKLKENGVSHIIGTISELSNWAVKSFACLGWLCLPDLWLRFLWRMTTKLTARGHGRGAHAFHHAASRHRQHQRRCRADEQPCMLPHTADIGQVSACLGPDPQPPAPGGCSGKWGQTDKLWSPQQSVSRHSMWDAPGLTYKWPPKSKRPAAHSTCITSFHPSP